MAAKVGVKPEEYAAAMPGTYFLTLDEAKKRYAKGDGLDSRLRLEQGRQRLQRGKQGLQGRAERRRLHRSEHRERR